MVAVVVPYRPGCPHRALAWDHIRNRHEAAGRTVHTAPGPDGPWCKARAIHDAIQATSDDTLVISDADVWVDDLDTAIARTATSPAVVPHHTVHRLTESSTVDYVAGLTPTAFAERPYKGRACGGVVVIRREVWEQTPMDPRFLGWGGEDDSWNLAITSVFGKPARLDADLWHLWHPPQDRLSRGVGNEANRDLYRRYIAAVRHPAAMAALIREARAHLEVS